MTKNKISKTLTDLVEPVLLPIGFKKYKGSDALVFRRITDFGNNEVPILIWNYVDFFYISLGFRIRIDRINKLFIPYSKYVVDEDDTTATLNASINNFGYDGDHKIKVENEGDLQGALNILYGILVNKGLAFFERYNTVTSIDEVLNSEGEEANLFVDQFFHRAVIGLSAAALNNNPKFNYWIAYYKEKLSDRDVPKLNGLIDYINTNIINQKK
jgi:hypothetical protein